MLILREAAHRPAIAPGLPVGQVIDILLFGQQRVGKSEAGCLGQRVREHPGMAPLALLEQRRVIGAHADQAVCRILGVHLEGPFISEARKGAHRAECMLDPSQEALDELLGNEATREVLLTVTLAPERDHAQEAIRRLVAEGIIVSVGHSNANAKES